jgi:hypothetical protein
VKDQDAASAAVLDGQSQLFDRGPICVGTIQDRKRLTDHLIVGVTRQQSESGICVEHGVAWDRGIRHDNAAAGGGHHSGLKKIISSLAEQVPQGDT